MVAEAQSYLLRHAGPLLPESAGEDQRAALEECGLTASSRPEPDPILLAEALRGFRNACTGDGYRQALHQSATGRVLRHVAASAVAAYFCAGGTSELQAMATEGGAPLMPECDARRSRGIAALAASEYCRPVVCHALAFCVNYSTSYSSSYCVDLVDAGLVGLVLGVLPRTDEPMVPELALWLFRNLSRDARFAVLVPSYECLRPGTRTRLLEIVSSPASVVGEFAVAGVVNFLSHSPEALVSWLEGEGDLETLPAAASRLLENQAQPVMAVAAQLVRVLAAVTPRLVAQPSFSIPERLVRLACAPVDTACSDSAIQALTAILSRCRFFVTHKDDGAAPPEPQTPFFANSMQMQPAPIARCPETAPFTMTGHSLQMPDSVTSESSQRSSDGSAAYAVLCTAVLQQLTQERLVSIVHRGTTGGPFSCELVCACVTELLRFSQSARVVISSHEALYSLFAVAGQSPPPVPARAQETMRFFKTAWRHLRPEEQCPFGRSRNANSRPQSMS